MHYFVLALACFVLVVNGRSFKNEEKNKLEKIERSVEMLKREIHSLKDSRSKKVAAQDNLVARRVEKLGCFKDNPQTPAFMSYQQILFFNSTYEVVQLCAKIASEMGYQYFGIEFYGECWYGQSETTVFSRNGQSDNCLEGLVGRESTVMAYKVVESEKLVIN